MTSEAPAFLGEAFALASPLAWSFAVILFRKAGEVVPPIALNTFKNVLAMALFGATFLVWEAWFGDAGPAEASPRDYALLLASGAIGIAVADTLLLACLNRVGAGRQAIVNTAYSPPIILLSYFFLGERLSPIQLVGVGAILSAVLIVGMGKSEPGGTRRELVVGVLLGVGACLCQAVSIVMVKPSMESWPLLWTTSWRMAGGVAGSLLALPFVPNARRAMGTLANRRAWKTMVPAAVIGTYLSLLFWLGGFKYTSASKASALNQTATLFTFVLAVLLLKEPVTPRRLTGLALGFAGVLLVTVGGDAA